MLRLSVLVCFVQISSTYLIEQLYKQILTLHYIQQPSQPDTTWHSYTEVKVTLIKMELREDDYVQGF